MIMQHFFSKTSWLHQGGSFMRGGPHLKNKKYEVATKMTNTSRLYEQINCRQTLFCFMIQGLCKELSMRALWIISTSWKMTFQFVGWQFYKRKWLVIQVAFLLSNGHSHYQAAFTTLAQLSTKHLVHFQESHDSWKLQHPPYFALFTTQESSPSFIIYLQPKKICWVIWRVWVPMYYWEKVTSTLP